MFLLLLEVYCSFCLLYYFFVFKWPVLRSDRLRGLREKMREEKRVTEEEMVGWHP